MSSPLPPRAPAAPSPRLAPAALAAALARAHPARRFRSAPAAAPAAAPPRAGAWPRPRQPGALSAPARSRAPLSAPWGRGSRGNPGRPPPGRRPRWSTVCLGTWDVTVPGFELVTGTGPQRRTLLWPGNRCEQPTPLSFATLGAWPPAAALCTGRSFL